VCFDGGTTTDAGNDAANDSGADASGDAAKDSGPVDSGADAADVADAADTGVVDAGPPVSQPWGTTVSTGKILRVAVDAQKNIALAMRGPNIEKWDAQGNPKWKKPLIGDLDFYGVVFDPQGNLYAVGQTYGTSDLGGGSIGVGGFIVKYDPSGNYVWHRGSYPGWLWGVAIKSNGNVVAVGALEAAQDFGGGTIPCNNGPDVLALEVTSSGQYVRAKTFGANIYAYQYATSCALDANDNLVLGGMFEGSLTFGGQVLTGPQPGGGPLNLFVAKLDGSFNHLASIDFKSDGNNQLESLATDSNGNVFVTGSFSSTIDLGGGVLTPAGLSDIFLGKLGPSLSHHWSKRYGDAAYQHGYGVALDPNGNVAITGSYEGSTDFGKGNLPATNAGWGMFTALFDGAGNVLSNFGSGSSNNSSCAGFALAHLTAPDFVVVGEANGYCNVPTGKLVGNNQYAGLVARFAP
jgi:hypothetical protein